MDSFQIPATAVEYKPLTQTPYTNLKTATSSPKGLLVLSGPNLAGKTYLADYLRNTYGCHYIHCTYRWKKRMYTYHLAALSRALKMADHKLVIIDRLWLSELIYAAVYRGGTKWPLEGRLLDKLILKGAALTVFCLLTQDEIKNNFSKCRANRTDISLEKTLEVAYRYATYWNTNKTREDYVQYRIKDEGQHIKLFTEQLLGRLNSHREAQYQPALNSTTRNFAGHLKHAKYLMVGEQVNHRDYKRCWPFMAYASSSLFLAQTFEKLQLHENEFLWTNAICKETHVKQLLTLKPSLKVIALGKEADNSLTALNIKHAVVSHPAYGQRFCNLTTYSNQLYYGLFCS